MKSISIIADIILKKDIYKEFFVDVAKTFGNHSVFILIVTFYICVLKLTSFHLKMEERTYLCIYNKSFMLIFLLFIVCMLIGYMIYVMIFVRPKKLLRFIYCNIIIFCSKRDRILNSIIIIFFMLLFMSAFTSFKALIPIINPFCWDPTLAKIDATIHFGFHPWQLLQPIIGYPVLTSIINFFYNLWLFVMLFVLCWQAFSVRDVKLRMQFFVSFILLWAVLGTGFAILFSSAGPCFYDKIIPGGDIYSPLMNYLNSVRESYPIWALSTQETLWKTYENNMLSLGAGISAMPSLHVGTSFLFALVGWQSHRNLGVVFSIFAFIIMIGSVHLAWHYAIDGYFAIFLTFLIWQGAGYFLRGQSERSHN